MEIKRNEAPSRQRKVTSIAATLAIGCLASSLAMAQERYPSRAVTLVVPYAAGGLADLVARPLAAVLERQLKQPIVVVSKPGASGSIGTQSVANGPADGYTLLVSLVSISTLPTVNAVLGRPNTFAREQFTPIARLVADPCVVFVRADAPWKTFAEFLADAKRRPGAITYASSGQYGPTHIPTEMLAQVTGTKMLHVPATGGGPAMNLLLGGHVDLFFTVPALGAQYVEAGKLRALAVTGAKRIAEFPNVPTLNELGIDVDYVVWAGLFAPKDVPTDVREIISKAVAMAVDDPVFKNGIAKGGTTLAYQGPQEFLGWWNEDAKKLEAFIKEISANAQK
ncbi:MAG: tripartite tricarboxylate transporter substrate binding protein [Proteobacteria bacterium]|nr:tripartite tricarboxylate transporter substrate binding protein [Pseudomonadota bacterium]